MNEILQYLKTHGERLDADIAVATGIPLSNVRLHLSELTSRREVMSCHSIWFENGKKVEGIRCRLVGYISPPHSGKKKKSQLNLW